MPLNGEKLDVHRPHPGKEALKYRVQDARNFLQMQGLLYEQHDL